MSEKCQHDNLSITEKGSWFTEHCCLDGEWEHDNNPGGYSAMLDICCLDCDRRWRYSRYGLPRWLDRRMAGFDGGHTKAAS